MDTTITSKLDTFFTQFKQQHYKKGETLIRADEDPTGVFYIKNGSVKQYAISKKGDELVLNMFKPPAFFPMSWAINSTPNNYYFQAVTDVEVWRAPKEEVIEFINNNPDILYDLMGRVYRGTDGMLMRMVHLMSGSAYSRLITELLIQAKRFGKKNLASFELKITETDLATSAGMTRETVSREMKMLKEKGLVTVCNNLIIIHDINKLEEALSS